MGTLTGKYRGFSGDWERPFYIQPEGNPSYISANIRPLPAAETEPDDDAREQPDPHCVKCHVYMQHRCCGETVDGKRLYNHPDDNLKPEPNPLLTRLAAAEQELAAIRAEIARSAT
jgi:hypothetical protein